MSIIKHFFIFVIVNRVHGSGFKVYKTSMKKICIITECTVVKRILRLSSFTWEQLMPPKLSSTREEFLIRDGF